MSEESENRLYGVWKVVTKPELEGGWFVNDATRIIFSTPNIDLAFAQTKAACMYGMRVAEIGSRGDPLFVEISDNDAQVQAERK